MVVHGINTYVDGNFFQGSLTKLRNFGLWFYLRSFSSLVYVLPFLISFGSF
jgi:hypothetical protein